MKTFMRGWGTCLAIPAFAVLFLAGTALALPCGGKTVTSGATEEEVASACGEAMFKERRRVRLETEDKSGARRSTTTIYDEWAFDFGPGELMEAFRFENGRLMEIAGIGYGRSPDATADTCRNGELLAAGDSTLEAFLKCGEPIAKEPQPDKVVETSSGGESRRTTVTVVDWTYRYGPDLPGYTLRFEDGRVTGFRSREFGK